MNESPATNTPVFRPYIEREVPHLAKMLAEIIGANTQLKAAVQASEKERRCYDLEELTLYEYIIKGTHWQAKEEELYAAVYQEMYDKLISSSKYENADDEKKLTLHQTLQSDARAETRKQLARLIRDTDTKSTEKK